MTPVTEITAALDQLFSVQGLTQDPSMSRNVPRVYEAAGTDWRGYFLPEFCERFNGLMLQGAPTVQRVFTTVFPSCDALDLFLAQARPGDLLFLHHPIDCRNGNPRGRWAEGFVPISQDRLDAIRDGNLSVYACHAPMDTNRGIGTTDAMVEALGATVLQEFMEYGAGYAGRVCRISPTSTDDLEAMLLRTYNIPYLEREGTERSRIEVAAVLAGIGDNYRLMEHVEALGAEAYITGELHVRIEGDWGRHKFVEVEEFSGRTGMSLFGVSHAASEQLVMESQMPRWFREVLKLEVIPIREKEMWR